MKAIFSLVLASIATALPVFEQIPINAELATFPGFDLDLNAQRLVQLEGQAPVWMTELEKVNSDCPIYHSQCKHLLPDSSQSTRHQVL